MSDDTAPNVTIDVLEAKVVVFRQQPEARGFAQLRQELRDAGRGELLAELCATWAQHERDPVRAADAWSEAGEAMVVLGEIATAAEYLRTALELDPTNDRAADRLIEIVEPSDPAYAVEIIELELGELAKRDTAKRKPEVTQRRAAHHRKAAELWNDFLGRVDRALWHWQQAWKLEPHRTEALEAARQLYKTLGDDAMVAKLYQAELDVLATDRTAGQRRASIRLELGKLALRAKDLETAANHLEEASKLDPTSLEISEKLADVYAMPGFRDGQTRGKASELFVDLGRRRMATRDDSDRSQLPAACGRHRPVREVELRGAAGGAVRQLAVDRARSDPAPPHQRRPGSRRARRGPAPPRRPVPNAAARPREPDRGADRARRVRAAGQQGDAASCATSSARIRTGKACRG